MVRDSPASWSEMVGPEMGRNVPRYFNEYLNYELAKAANFKYEYKRDFFNVQNVSSDHIVGSNVTVKELRNPDHCQ